MTIHETFDVFCIYIKSYDPMTHILCVTSTCWIVGVRGLARESTPGSTYVLCKYIVVPGTYVSHKKLKNYISHTYTHSVL